MRLAEKNAFYLLLIDCGNSSPYSIPNYDFQNSLRPMVEKGVIGFKCFLIHSGIDDFPSVNEEQVDRALAELKGTGKILAVSSSVPPQ